jgi:hypothetical protein
MIEAGDIFLAKQSILSKNEGLTRKGARYIRFWFVVLSDELEQVGNGSGR